MRLFLTVLLITMSGCIDYSINGTVDPWCAINDSNNSRVLIWKTKSLTNFQAADIVLGQPDFTSNAQATTRQGFKGGAGGWIHSDGTRFVYSDAANNRVLIWNTIPTTNYQAADIVLGQQDFTSGGADSGGISASSIENPNGVFIIGERLYVIDNNNHRMLAWTTFPTVNFQAADLVIGQPNFTTQVQNSTGINASSAFRPAELYTDGTKTIQAQRNNNRVLIWNYPLISNGQAADVVLGQQLFSTATANLGGVNAQGMLNPFGILVVGERLFLSSNDHRVLIWNTIPTTNYQAADLVLGQADFSGQTANRGGTASSVTMSGPVGMGYDGERFFVADATNNRVLVWNSLPTTTSQPADIVLGQPDMSSNSANTGLAAPTAKTLSNPLGVYCNGNVKGIWRRNGY